MQLLSAPQQIPAEPRKRFVTSEILSNFMSSLAPKCDKICSVCQILFLSFFVIVAAELHGLNRRRLLVMKGFFYNGGHILLLERPTSMNNK